MVLSYISRPLDGPKYIYSYVDKAHYRKLGKPKRRIIRT